MADDAPATWLPFALVIESFERAIAESNDKMQQRRTHVAMQVKQCDVDLAAFVQVDPKTGALLVLLPDEPAPALAPADPSPSTPASTTAGTTAATAAESAESQLADAQQFSARVSRIRFTLHTTHAVLHGS